MIYYCCSKYFTFFKNYLRIIFGHTINHSPAPPKKKTCCEQVSLELLSFHLRHETEPTMQTQYARAKVHWFTTMQASKENVVKLDPVPGEPKDVQEGKIGADKEAEAEHGRQKQENIAWLRRKKKEKNNESKSIQNAKNPKSQGTQEGWPSIVTTGNTSRNWQ